MSKDYIQLLRDEYNNKKKDLNTIKTSIVSMFEANLESVKNIDSISGRVKGKESFINKVKMNRTKYPDPFHDVEDIIGIRILVLFISTSGLVAKKIKEDILPPVEDSYRREATPKLFGYEGYQSIHSIPDPLLMNYGPSFPRVFELQVRTLYQHAYAEPQHELEYKKHFELTPEEEFNYRKRFSWLAASSWGADSILEEQYAIYKEHEPT